jgi:hypothetical protein
LLSEKEIAKHPIGTFILENSEADGRKCLFNGDGKWLSHTPYRLRWPVLSFPFGVAVSNDNSIALAKINVALTSLHPAVFSIRKRGFNLLSFAVHPSEAGCLLNISSVCCRVDKEATVTEIVDHINVVIERLVNK